MSNDKPESSTSSEPAATPADPSSVASAEAGEAAPPAEAAKEAKPSIVEPAAETSSTEGELDRILEIPLTIKVEVGQTRMTIEELFNLGPGTVIELDKRAGEPVDILVANKAIAKGDPVVVNESFGVKINNIISPQSRVKSLA